MSNSYHVSQLLFQETPTVSLVPNLAAAHAQDSDKVEMTEQTACAIAAAVVTVGSLSNGFRWFLFAVIIGI